MSSTLIPARKWPTELKFFPTEPGQMGSLMEFQQNLHRSPGLLVGHSMAPAGIRMDPNGSTSIRKSFQLVHFFECY